MHKAISEAGIVNVVSVGTAEDRSADIEDFLPTSQVEKKNQDQQIEIKVNIGKHDVQALTEDVPVDVKPEVLPESEQPEIASQKSVVKSRPRKSKGETPLTRAVQKEVVKPDVGKEQDVGKQQDIKKEQVVEKQPLYEKQQKIVKQQQIGKQQQVGKQQKASKQDVVEKQQEIGCREEIEKQQESENKLVEKQDAQKQNIERSQKVEKVQEVKEQELEKNETAVVQEGKETQETVKQDVIENQQKLELDVHCVVEKEQAPKQEQSAEKQVEVVKQEVPEREVLKQEAETPENVQKSDGINDELLTSEKKEAIIVDNKNTKCDSKEGNTEEKSSISEDATDINQQEKAADAAPSASGDIDVSFAPISREYCTCIIYRSCIKSYCLTILRQQ